MIESCRHDESRACEDGEFGPCWVLGLAAEAPWRLSKHRGRDT